MHNKVRALAYKLPMQTPLAGPSHMGGQTALLNGKRPGRLD